MKLLFIKEHFSAVINEMGALEGFSQKLAFADIEALKSSLVKGEEVAIILNGGQIKADQILLLSKSLRDISPDSQVIVHTPPANLNNTEDSEMIDLIIYNLGEPREIFDKLNEIKNEATKIFDLGQIDEDGLNFKNEEIAINFNLLDEEAKDERNETVATLLVDRSILDEKLDIGENAAPVNFDLSLDNTLSSEETLSDDLKLEAENLDLDQATELNLSDDLDLNLNATGLTSIEENQKIEQVEDELSLSDDLDFNLNSIDLTEVEESSPEVDPSEGELNLSDDLDLSFNTIDESQNDEISDPVVEEVNLDDNLNFSIDEIDNQKDTDTSESGDESDDLPFGEEDLNLNDPDSLFEKPTEDIQDEAEEKPILSDDFSSAQVIELKSLVEDLSDEKRSLETKVGELEHNAFHNERLVDDRKKEIGDLLERLEKTKNRYEKDIDLLNKKIEFNSLSLNSSEKEVRKKEMELDELRKQVHHELTRIKARERELESKLDLIQVDSSSQIKSRDKMILDLRRKIDLLQFDLEQAQSKEQSVKDSYKILEEKFDKIMRSLKGAFDDI